MRRRPAPVAPVSWRDGVHLTDTPIWCDARRRRDVCFASAADRVMRGHGQLIGTPETLALVGVTSDLAVPLRRRFTLGTLRLELVPSGRGLGAAALHVDIAGRSVLYAGVVRTTSGGLGELAEVRAADAVVVAAPVDAPAFPPLAEAVAAARAWASSHERPVLVAASVLDALEAASLLGVPVTGGKALRDAIERTKLPIELGKTGVTIRITGERAKDAGPHATMAEFGWSTAAGVRDLVAWVASTQARAVYVTGPHAETVAGAIGPHAHVLGPPVQLELGT